MCQTGDLLGVNELHGSQYWSLVPLAPLHGDYAQVRRALTELLRLLVDLRLIPTLRGRKVFKLKHHQARRLPVALKDDEFAAADQKSAAAYRDRSRRCGLVLLITLWVGDVGFGDDIPRHGGTLRLPP